MALKSVRVLTFLALALAAAAPLRQARAGAAGPKEPTVAEYVAMLKGNADVEAKLAALRKLGTITETEERNYNVVDTLIEVTTRTQDPHVGRNAPLTLMTIQKNVSQRAKSKYLKPFTGLLRDNRTLPGTRSGIAENFRITLDKDGVEDRDAVRALVEIAKSNVESNALRAKCLEAIGAFGSGDNIVMLAELLSDKEAQIREAAVKALILLLEKDVSAAAQIPMAGVNKLKDMVRDEQLDENVRVIVILAMSQMVAAQAPGANSALDDIIKLARTNTKDAIVAAAIEGLGIIGTAQAAEPLISIYPEYQKEGDWPVRQRLAKALRNILRLQADKTTPEMQAVKNIVKLFVEILDKDPSMQVKESVVIALAYLHIKRFEGEQKEAVAALVFLLEKTGLEQTLKSMILDTLESITRQNFGPDVKRWKEWLQKIYGIK